MAQYNYEPKPNIFVVCVKLLSEKSYWKVDDWWEEEIISKSIFLETKVTQVFSTLDPFLKV